MFFKYASDFLLVLLVLLFLFLKHALLYMFFEQIGATPAVCGFEGLFCVGGILMVDSTLRFLNGNPHIILFDINLQINEFSDKIAHFAEKGIKTLRVLLFFSVIRRWLLSFSFLV